MKNRSAKKPVAKIPGREPIALFPNAKPLAAQQERCACLAAFGKSDKEIAGELGIAAKTVGEHLGLVFKKLGLHSRVELAHLFLSRGLVINRYVEQVEHRDLAAQLRVETIAFMQRRQQELKLPRDWTCIAAQQVATAAYGEIFEVPKAHRPKPHA